MIEVGWEAEAESENATKAAESVSVTESFERVNRSRRRRSTRSRRSTTPTRRFKPGTNGRETASSRNENRPSGMTVRPRRSKRSIQARS